MGGPDGFGYNPDLEPYEYDPEKSRQLLAEAGYPNGFTITGSGTMGRYYRDREVMQAVVAYLADIGINLEVEYLESGIWIDRLLSATLEPIWDIGMTYAGRDPGVQLGSRLDWPEQNKKGEYDDPVFKEMWLDQHLTSDPDERLLKIQALHEYVCDQAYGIFIYQIPAIYGISPNVHGVTFGSSYDMDITNAYVE
jgi:peptide/nickel transport system substrate-binding protein